MVVGIAADEVDHSDGGQAAERAEGPAGEVGGTEDAEPGAEHQRMQGRAGAVDPAEAAEQLGEAVGPRDLHRHDLVIPEARCVQVPEPQARGDHQDCHER